MDILYMTILPGQRCGARWKRRLTDQVLAQAEAKSTNDYRKRAELIISMLFPYSNSRIRQEFQGNSWPKDNILGKKTEFLSFGWYNVIQ